VRVNIQQRVSFVLVVDMVGDMRGCGPLDVGNGRMGFHVDNGMDFFDLFSDWLTCMPPLPRCF
jgi:hypothetical protein